MESELANAVRWSGIWDRVENWAFLAVVVFLAIEFAAHHFAGPYKEVVEKARASEIARLNNETEQLQNDNLRLRKELGPRNLPFGTFVEALKGKPSAPVEVLYVADDFDSMALAQQIAEGLKAAGWPEPTRSPIWRPIGWSDPLPMSVDGQPTGVTVVASIPDSREEYFAGNGLPAVNAPMTPFRALQEALLAGLGKAQSHVNGPRAPKAGALRVVVAPRG